MDKIFAEMFSKQPDEIIAGDYFYHITWFKDLLVEAAKNKGFTLQEFLKWRENIANKRSVKIIWEEKTFQGELYQHNAPWLESFKGENKDDNLIAIINRIAIDNKPFMDIASSESMGLAPYFIKNNPKKPCLVTDIDLHVMKLLR